MKNQGVIGDLDTTLPKSSEAEIELKKQQLVEEQMADFFEKDEYKRLKEFLEGRIKYYQRFLPGSSVPLKDTSIQEKDLPMYWKIACTVIEEFEQVINDYQNAHDAVEKAKKDESGGN